MNLFTDRRRLRELETENAALKAKLAQIAAGKSSARQRRAQSERSLIRAMALRLDLERSREMVEF